jgi:hypothetical protein
MNIFMKNGRTKVKKTQVNVFMPLVPKRISVINPIKNPNIISSVLLIFTEAISKGAKNING